MIFPWRWLSKLYNCIFRSHNWKNSLMNSSVSKALHGVKCTFCGRENGILMWWSLFFNDFCEFFWLFSENLRKDFSKTTQISQKYFKIFHKIFQIFCMNYQSYPKDNWKTSSLSCCLNGRCYAFENFNVHLPRWSLRRAWLYVYVVRRVGIQTNSEFARAKLEFRFCSRHIYIYAKNLTFREKRSRF